MGPHASEAQIALYGKQLDANCAENSHLLLVPAAATGLADVFGQAGSACQATELWHIRCHALGLDPRAADAATAPSATPAKQPAKPAKTLGMFDL